MTQHIYCYSIFSAQCIICTDKDACMHGFLNHKFIYIAILSYKHNNAFISTYLIISLLFRFRKDFSYISAN